MQIAITVEEAIMLSAVKQMRQIIKSNASKARKEKAVNVIFWELMHTMDSKCFDEEDE